MIEETTDKSAPAEAAPVADASAPIADASTPVAASPAKKPRKPRAPRAPPTKHKSGKRKSLAPLTIEERFATGVFTIPEAARHCACSVSSINKYIREGHLAVAKYPGSGCTRILGPALARFMRGE
jgi:hypothetical protein